ncbi:helix-turn-helix domain-containing protein [Desulfurispirillum indicum]|uniref:helix-turn-helix transcriptional regulator n=1 Tax=Desulfurispirillum indicum TaxID=936456 RepID=UPI001CF95BEA|nr:helix-turn-helix transcriptional regulator [Desulfurispirillum indicum]UCZ56511.1 helix-turn-helix domain-containing protein [Desulfurispirillum indicum]
MSKAGAGVYSRYTQDAMLLLASLIRESRLERRMTAQEVADRAGISRGLLQRIEKGDLKCQVGAVFEVALIVGVPLFGMDDEADLRFQLHQTRAKLALMPQSIRRSNKQVQDDF